MLYIKYCDWPAEYKDTFMGSQRYHYSVLFTRTEKQSVMQKALSGVFPESRGKIFLPMREYYRRDRKENFIKPLFPGYLFVYSDMGREELHEFLSSHRVKVASFLKELGLQGKSSPRKNLPETAGAAYKEGLADLTEEESSFLNAVLDENGVQRMSSGYRESNGKVVVMEGPLLAFADRIARVDRHERTAYLNLKFREFDIVAGLEIKPKKYYFPDDQNAPTVLGDGTEVDLIELKKRMMEG